MPARKPAAKKDEPAVTPDTVTSIEKPAATVKAEKAAVDRADEVRDIQLDVHSKNVTNVPAEPVATIYANAPEKGDPDSVTFALVGGEVVMTTTAKEMRFGREEWHGFMRKVNQAGSGL